MAARITPWFHEDEVCWVAECSVCAVPMVVWKHHGPTPPDHDLEHMLACLRAVAESRLGKDNFSIDQVMRQIPDHFYAHARSARWWLRRLTGGG